MNNNYFMVFAESFLQGARQELHDILAGQSDIRALDLDGILAGISAAIGEVCFRTLLVEFRICDLNGKLTAATVREKVTDYQSSFLSVDQYRKSVLEIYPELEHLCKSVAEQQKIQMKEMLYRLFRDKSGIEKILLDGVPFGEVKKIRIGQGDRHCGGKAVVELCLDEGRAVYYKPRPLDAEQMFYKLLDQMEYAISGERDSFSGICRCLNCGEYGWMKKVDYRECVFGKEIQRFYRRIGMQAGISFLLGCHDLHYQNLVAHGEYPILIDLENVFRTDEADGMDYSVLDSNLLPKGTRESRYCAVTGGWGERVEYEVPVIRESDDGLRIAYERPQMEKGRNLPEKNVDIALYLQELTQGFDFAYRYLYQIPEEELSGFITENMVSRYLIHGTRFYRAVLEASFHPSLMSGIEERKAFISRMCPEGAEKKYEMEDLGAGDIPYFYRRADSRSLYSSSGAEIEGYFKETVGEAVLRRKRAMNESDRALQTDLIRISLRIGKIREKDLTDSAYFCDATENTAKNWLEMAFAIADHIADKALWNRERTAVTWIIPKYSDRKGTDITAGWPDHYLYEGFAGIAIFMRAANLACAKYGELCDAVEQRLFSYTDDILTGRREPESEHTGLFCGEASVLYTYQQLYQMTEERRYLLYAKKHTEIVMKLTKKDKACDLMYGNAGAIAAFCDMFKLTGEAEYLECAERTELFLRSQMKQDGEGGYWVSQGRKKPCAGIAHGNSGLMRSYGKLCRYRNNSQDYESILRGILTHENTLFLRRISERNLSSWCHGELGILYSYMELKRETGDKYNRFTNCILERATEIMQGVKLRKSMCLCHGNIGNLLLLKSCQQASEKGKILTNIFEEEVRGLLGREGLLMPVESINPGLMTGLAGIGYGCLLLGKIC